MKTPSPLALLKADLRRSGIPWKHAKKLKLKTMNSVEIAEFLGVKKAGTACAYKIPFFDHNKKPINFARLRLLKGRWKVGDIKKSTFKYNQRANTAPHLYFSPLYDWPIDKQTGKIKLKYLCITEGEKKAIKACLSGIPTVALAGVFNFKSKKRGITLLEEFNLFDLKHTAIDICYDSDLSYNEHVRLAMNQLSAELATLAPKSVSFVYLESAEGEVKVGLDDYLATFTSAKEARAAFEKLPRRSDSRADALSALNEELVFVKEQGQYFSVIAKKFRERAQLLNEYGPRYRVPSPEDPKKMVPAIDIWMRSRLPETDVDGVVYEPGKKSRFRPKGKGIEVVNTWQAPELLPAEGEPVLWLELFDHLTSNLRDAEKKWLMQWFAYPLQHVGTKLAQAVFIYSYGHGIGKNSLVEKPVKQMYGPHNYRRIDGADIESSFNGWIAERQFVFIDEIYVNYSKSLRASIMGRLNSFITNEDLNLSEKYQPSRTVRNYANLYITSNHSDALPISEKDRRVFSVNAPDTPLSAKFFKAYNKWLDQENGAAQILNHLKHVDLTEFNPNGHAPVTRAKNEMIAISRNPMDELAAKLKQAPEAFTMVAGVLPDLQLYEMDSIVQIMARYVEEHRLPRTSLAPNALGVVFKRLGVPNRRLKIRNGLNVSTLTLYAVLNANEWSTKNDAEWVDHFRRFDKLKRFKQELPQNVIPFKGKVRDKDSPGGAQSNEG